MGVYHYSACHDCKEKIMWPKTTDRQAFVWHRKLFNKLHPEHDTQLSNDYDDEFYDRISRYKYIEIKNV
jgi:hypothetical protein